MIFFYENTKLNKLEKKKFAKTKKNSYALL